MSDETGTDLNRLFHARPGAQQIVALAEKAAIAHNTAAGEALAAVFSLLDRETKEPAGKSLFVVLSPADAQRLAALIQAHAKARGWPELTEIQTTETELGPKRN